MDMFEGFGVECQVGIMHCAVLCYVVQVGYVQGMGFVSAILLMYMSEEAAFWTLVALLKGE